MITDEVKAALKNLETAFPDSEVTHDEDGSGGAYVRVSPLSLGEGFDPVESWVAFHLTYQYPEVDVYPHYMDAGVKPKVPKGTQQPLGDGLAYVTWREKPVIQISRRTNGWNRLRHNATNKLHKVLEWLRSP